MCNRFSPSKENNPHRLCVPCGGKSCKINNHYEECHDWSDNLCNQVSEYMHKLLLQREKKRKRKAKAASSSSSFSGFSPSKPVILCQLPSSAGNGVVTTIPLSMVCAVTFSATALMVSTVTFVLPVDVFLVELWVASGVASSLRGERARMLALPAVLAPVLLAVPIAVSVTSAAASSTRSGSSSRSAASSSHSREQWWSRPSSGPRPVPVWSPSFPAPASPGSQSCHPSSTQSRSLARLFQLLRLTLVPVPVPGLGVVPACVGLLLLVRVLHWQGYPLRRLVGHPLRGHLLGCFPGVSLLLLTFRNAILILAHGLRLGARTRTVRRSNLRWILFQ